MIVPLELSVKVTVRGSRPVTGVAAKSAAGTIAAAPRSELIRVAPVSVLKTTTLLKLPGDVGENWITRFVDANPAKENCVTDTMSNGPLERVAEALVIEAPP